VDTALCFAHIGFMTKSRDVISNQLEPLQGGQD